MAYAITTHLPCGVINNSNSPSGKPANHAENPFYPATPAPKQVLDERTATQRMDHDYALAQHLATRDDKTGNTYQRQYMKPRIANGNGSSNYHETSVDRSGNAMCYDQAANSTCHDPTGSGNAPSERSDHSPFSFYRGFSQSSIAPPPIAPGEHDQSFSSQPCRYFKFRRLHPCLRHRLRRNRHIRHRRRRHRHPRHYHLRYSILILIRNTFVFVFCRAYGRPKANIRR